MAGITLPTRGLREERLGPPSQHREFRQQGWVYEQRDGLGNLIGHRPLPSRVTYMTHGGGLGFRPAGASAPP